MSGTLLSFAESPAEKGFPREKFIELPFLSVKSNTVGSCDEEQAGQPNSNRHHYFCYRYFAEPMGSGIPIVIVAQRLAFINSENSFTDLF
jgi:hypothetical protein